MTQDNPTSAETHTDLEAPIPATYQGVVLDLERIAGDEVSFGGRGFFVTSTQATARELAQGVRDLEAENEQVVRDYAALQIAHEKLGKRLTAAEKALGEAKRTSSAKISQGEEQRARLEQQLLESSEAGEGLQAILNRRGEELADAREDLAQARLENRQGKERAEELFGYLGAAAPGQLKTIKAIGRVIQTLDTDRPYDAIKADIANEPLSTYALLRIANKMLGEEGGKIPSKVLKKAQAMYELVLEETKDDDLELNDRVAARMGLQAIRSLRAGEPGTIVTVIGKEDAPIPERQFKLISEEDPTLTRGNYSRAIQRLAFSEEIKKGEGIGLISTAESYTLFVRAAYELHWNSQGGKSLGATRDTTELVLSASLKRDPSLLPQAIKLAEHYSKKEKYEPAQVVMQSIQNGGELLESEEKTRYAVAIGRAALSCENVDVKVALYEASLQVEESAIRWENLGLLHKREGETEKAFAAYSNALRVNPNAKFAPREVERLGEEIDPQALGQLPELYTQSLEVEAEIIQS